jgi:hypothetical protein
MTRSVFFLLLSSALVVGCAGDPATFRPAKGASDRPAVKDSFRIKAPTDDCVSLGYINAEGPRALADIAETAARHGANNYIVHADNGDERVTTVENRHQLVSRTNHKLVAEALRCGLPDGPAR